MTPTTPQNAGHEELLEASRLFACYVVMAHPELKDRPETKRLAQALTSAEGR